MQTPARDVRSSIFRAVNDLRNFLLDPDILRHHPFLHRRVGHDVSAAVSALAPDEVGQQCGQIEPERIGEDGAPAQHIRRHRGWAACHGLEEKRLVSAFLDLPHDRHQFMLGINRPADMAKETGLVEVLE